MHEESTGSNIVANQIGALEKNLHRPKDEEEDDVECVDTKVCIWDGDEFEEFTSEYLNQIFPYKINVKSMHSSCQFVFHFLAGSLHYWVELKQDSSKEPEEGKLGVKDQKFLQDLFNEDQTDNFIAFRRWGKNFMQKEQFLKHEEQEPSFQPPKGGEEVHEYAKGEKQFTVIKYTGTNKDFFQFKRRMEVLFLFYIDGVSFVNEEVDTWIYYVIFEKTPKKQPTKDPAFRFTFVGVLSMYAFKISTLKERHRISQVFILPSHQKLGHGKELLDLVYDISLKNERCFEITTEIPSFEYQCLRDSKEAEMMLCLKLLDPSLISSIKSKDDMISARETLLGKQRLRAVKERLKLPGHQIQRIVFTLIYAQIIKQDDDMLKAHFEELIRANIIRNRSAFKLRRKLPHITFYGECPEMKEFFLEKSKEDFLRNQEEIQELLTETLDGYKRVIVKLRRLKGIDF